MQIILWLFLIGGGFWLYSNCEASRHVSGKTYYEACWKYKAGAKGFSEPTPGTPYEAGQWKQCEPVARQAFFDSGMIFSGNEEGADYDRVRAACPSLLSQVPMGGLFYMYVSDTEAAGGVPPVYALLPANFSIASWANGRWPNCSPERERQGISRVIRKADGTFAWEKPCAKCK
jgi:hypothetical protein